MIRNIHLYGRLKKQFGPLHRFDVTTAGEALRALNCAFPGEFVDALQTGSFKLVRGDRHSGFQLDMNTVNTFNLGRADLHLIPVASGASNGKGTAKTILGVALIGGAIFMSGGTLAAPLSMMGQPTIAGLGVTWGNIATIGLGLTLMGVSSLLTKPAAANNSDNTNSFAINGPSNMAKQGAAIPLVYGEVITGSVVVSFDANIEDIGAYEGSLGSYSGLTGILAAGGYPPTVDNGGAGGVLGSAI